MRGGQVAEERKEKEVLCHTSQSRPKSNPNIGRQLCKREEGIPYIHIYICSFYFKLAKMYDLHEIFRFLGKCSAIQEKFQ